MNDYDFAHILEEFQLPIPTLDIPHLCALLKNYQVVLLVKRLCNYELFALNMESKRETHF